MPGPATHGGKSVGSTKIGGFYPHGVFCLGEPITQSFNCNFDQWSEGELWGSMRVDIRVT